MWGERKQTSPSGWILRNNGKGVYGNLVCHILECKSLVNENEIITYLPNYKDLYGEDEDEQVYLARIIKDNLRRL